MMRRQILFVAVCTFAVSGAVYLIYESRPSTQREHVYHRYGAHTYHDYFDDELAVVWRRANDAAILGASHVFHDTGKLSWIVLTDSYLTKAGMHELQKFQEINYLDLSGSQLGESALCEAQHIPGLRDLNISEIKCEPRELECLRNIVGLRDLQVSPQQLDQELVDVLNQTNIRKLMFHCHDHFITLDEPLARVAQLKGIEEVYLAFDYDREKVVPPPGLFENKVPARIKLIVSGVVVPWKESHPQSTPSKAASAEAEVVP